MLKILTILFLPIWVYSQSTFKVSSGTTIVSTNDPIINLYNTDLHNGTNLTNLGIGTIWSITGNVPQTIYGTYISSLYGLRLNNSNGFALQANTTISNQLDMVNGDVLVGDYSLAIGTSTTNTGQVNWTSGTIIGPLKRWFAPAINTTQSSGIFPIGNDVTNRNVIINYTQAPTDGGYIIAEYKTGTPSMTDNYSGLPLWTSDGQLVQNYEDHGYFDITPYDYNSSLNTKQYTLTMRGNGLTTVNDRTTIRLVKSPGPAHDTWISCGTHSTVVGNSNSDFIVSSTGVVGFSWFNFGGQNNNPLPVELLYFEGVKYPTWNLLKWATASEWNSLSFVIEQSTDGETWREVITKPAAGTSNQLISYSYLDILQSFGINYYRLKQQDINGQIKSYGPIAIDNTKSKTVIRRYNLAGQEVDETVTGLIIEVFDDGTMQKIIK